MPGWVEPVSFAVVAVYLLAILIAPATRVERAWRFALLALAGFVGEASCIRLYGFYGYAPGWRLWLDGVPLAVVLVWPVVILSALALARELAPRVGVAGVAALCGLIVFADAALIEPVAVRAGLWSWTAPGLFAVPPIGVLGWAVFAGVGAAWFVWLDRSGASPYTLRRAELALLLVAPVAVHLALLGSWWGALRWVSASVPARYAVALVWTLSLLLAARARGATPPRLRTLLARLPGAGVFFALLALRGDLPLIVYVLAFPLPYLVLCGRALGPGREPRRRPWLRVALIVSLVIWDAFLLGPVPEVDTTVREVALPQRLDALEAQLAAEEAAVADVISGAEKRIVWANPVSPARTPLAVVYLHGFSATRQETAPLSDRVARGLGANLYYTRLTGHGRDGAALGEATVNAWLNDAYAAYRVGQRLGQRVILVGTSTGATLAAWLATQPDVELAAQVWISPNFAVRSQAARLLHAPWGGDLAQLVVGPERSWQAHNPAQEQFWTTRYPTRVLLELAGLLDLLASTDLSATRAPTLCLIAPDDRVIDPAVARARFAELPDPKQLIEVTSSGDPSHHVLAGDVLAPDDTAPRAEELLRFLRTHLR